jgi:hypothetical protein
MHNNTVYQGAGTNEMHDPPWEIECVRTRGINIKKNMLGDLINFQDMVTQSFEIFFVNPLSSLDLGKWISMINNYEDLGTWQTQIDLYGIKIDNCRITRESAPTSESGMESAVGRGKINLEIEQRIAGDTESIKNHPHYQGLDAIFQRADVYPYLEGISEEFTFNYGKGQQVDITHSLSITPFDSCPTGLTDCYDCFLDPGVIPIATFMADSQDQALQTCIAQGGDRAALCANQGADQPEGPGFPGPKTPLDPAGWITAGAGVSEICRPGQYDIHKALQLAREILDQNIPAFGLKYQPGQYKDIQINDDVICYYSETQNLITGACSMSKKITLLTEKDADLDWTATYKHSLTLDNSGILNVTETGTVKGNKKCLNDGVNVSDAAFQRSIDGMDEWLEGDPPTVPGDPYGAAALRCSEFYAEHICNFTGPWNNCCAPTTTTGVPTTPTPTTPAPSTTTTPRPALKDNLAQHTTTAAPGTTSAPSGTTTTSTPTTTTKPCSDCPLLSTGFPIDLSKNINGVGRDVSYSITFTDDPQMAQGYFASRELKATKNSSGVIEITEVSNLTQFQDKGSDASAPGPGTYPTNPQAPDSIIDNPWAIVYPLDKAGQATRVKDFYDSLKDFNIRDDGCLATIIKDAKLKSTSVNYNPNGRTLSYTVIWTGDKGISCEYPNEFGIRKVDISTEDKLPQRIREEYPIIKWKMLVHDAGQTDIGERSVNVKAFLDRVPKQNRLTDPELPKDSLEHMADPIAKDGLAEVFADNAVDNLVADDMYIKLCQWGFDSKGAANFSAAINYLQKR